VFRTGQRYGVGHLVDVLLGKDNEKVRNFGHEKLSVYGVGKALAEANGARCSASWWRAAWWISTSKATAACACPTAAGRCCVAK
jgi:superfamily II DNA helicase RecQ